MGEKPHEKRLEVGEFSVNYVELGSGEPMVMVHGSSPNESWKSLEALFRLSERYSLVVPDMIGYGKSSRPVETPDYAAQARIIHELTERLSIESAIFLGSGWGGQVALEIGLDWPNSVRELVLLASTYDKSQLPRLASLKKPTLILWDAGDMVAQLKAGYVLRDVIGTSRLETTESTEHEDDDKKKEEQQQPDVRTGHLLEKYHSGFVIDRITDFLSSPTTKVRKPPQLEPDLKGMALRESTEDQVDGQ